MTEKENSGSEYSSDFEKLEKQTHGIKNLDIGKQVSMASYCTACGKQGITKMLFLQVPKFQELAVSSFRCKNCGFYGNDVQQLGEYQSLGLSLTLQVKCARDLSRSLVRSSYCTVRIPEMNFEIQARPMSGVVTTVEGLLRQSADNLGLLQPERRAHNSAVADKIDEAIMQLLQLLEAAQKQTEVGQPVFSVVLTDPSGNSFIEPITDLLHLQEKHFQRSAEQAEALGLSAEQEEQIVHETKAIVVDEKLMKKVEDDVAITNIVSEMPSKCPACMKPVMHRSVIINIPYFKDCILMCCKCDDCGYKSVEVESAGAIPKFGRKTTLHVTDVSDLSREVLKSTSCSIAIPELGVELQAGTLGGIYTTLEGLMRQIHAELARHSQYWMGDSSKDAEIAANWKKTLEGLSEYADGKKNFTIVIDDPLDGSFIKNVYAPDPDPEMTIETYMRTAEQNAEYGFDLMDVGDE